MLKVKNIVKNYGSKIAVKDVGSTVKPGGVYEFLGHHGAGKMLVSTGKKREI